MSLLTGSCIALGDPTASTFTAASTILSGRLQVERTPNSLQDLYSQFGRRGGLRLYDKRQDRPLSDLLLQKESKGGPLQDLLLRMLLFSAGLDSRDLYDAWKADVFKDHKHMTNVEETWMPLPDATLPFKKGQWSIPYRYFLT